MHIAVMGIELALWQKITGVCQCLSSGAPFRNFDDAASHENDCVSLPLQEQI